MFCIARGLTDRCGRPTPSVNSNSKHIRQAVPDPTKHLCISVVQETLAVVAELPLDRPEPSRLLPPSKEDARSIINGATKQYEAAEEGLRTPFLALALPMRARGEDALKVLECLSREPLCQIEGPGHIVLVEVLDRVVPASPTLADVRAKEVATIERSGEHGRGIGESCDVDNRDGVDEVLVREFMVVPGPVFKASRVARLELAERVVLERLNLVLVGEADSGALFIECGNVVSTRRTS